MTSVEEFERRAQEAEQSQIPVYLKIGKAVVWFVYAFVVVNLVMLAMTFVLRLFGASTDAAFTRWVYRNSDFAMRPFRGIFPSVEIGQASVIDTSLLFGAMVYILVAVGVDALFQWLKVRLEREERATALARSTADAARFQAEMLNK